MIKLNQNSQHRLALDCAIYGYQDGEIKILLCPDTSESFKGDWSLVGGFLVANENIREGVERIMLSSLGVDNVYLKEVCTFSEIDRYPSERIISVLHYALVQVDELHQGRLRERGAKWFSINALPSLILDNERMINVAFAQLQREANHQLLGKELLPPFFTLLQLRCVYNCIFQREFEPANFRKKILSYDVLRKQVFKNTTESKKGAYYYAFDPAAESLTLDRIANIK